MGVRDNDKFMVRLPDGMRDRIKDSAAKSGRSMNAELVHVIEQEQGMRAYVATAMLHAIVSADPHVLSASAEYIADEFVAEVILPQVRAAVRYADALLVELEK
jgi:plasmid stability protein